MRKAISTSLTAVILSSLTVGAGAEAQESLTGHWKAEFQKEEVTRDYFLAIVQQGRELKGSLISARTRAYPFTSASVEGKKVSIDIERRYKSEDVLFKIRGEIQENGQIHGTLDIAGELVATIKMWRAPDPVGAWNVKARSLDSDELYDSRLEITRTVHGYTARFHHDGEVLKVRETGWAEGRMILALAFPTNDGDVPVVMFAEFVGENTIKGEWGIPETDRRSEWSATRAKPSDKKPAPKNVGNNKETKEAKPAPKKAPRPVSFAGEWRSKAILDDDETVKFTLKLSGQGSDLGGEIAGTAPSGVDFRSKLTSVKVDGRKISFAWEFEADGDTARVEMAAEVASDGMLKGYWETDDGEGKWEGQKVLRL